MPERVIDKKAVISRLKKALSFKSDTELADFLGIKKSTLSNWQSDENRNINIKLVFSKCEHISPEWILYGEGEMYSSSNKEEVCNSVPSIPLIPFDAVAGIPSIDNLGIAFADCDQYVIPEFAARGADFLVRVSGSSMYPKYSNGDILACHIVRDILFFQWGKIYVIDSSQGVLVKRIFQSDIPDHIRLVSDNKENYPPFEFPTSDIRSIAIVVGVIRLE